MPTSRLSTLTKPPRVPIFLGLWGLAAAEGHELPSGRETDKAQCPTLSSRFDAEEVETVRSIAGFSRGGRSWCSATPILRQSGGRNTDRRGLAPGLRPAQADDPTWIRPPKYRAGALPRDCLGGAALETGEWGLGGTPSSRPGGEA